MKPELWSIKFAVFLDLPWRDEAVPSGRKMTIFPMLERRCFLVRSTDHQWKYRHDAETPVPIHWLASSAGASECGIINETGRRTSPDSHKGLQIERRLNGWQLHLGYQFHVIPNFRRRIAFDALLLRSWNFAGLSVFVCRSLLLHCRCLWSSRGGAAHQAFW